MSVDYLTDPNRPPPSDLAKWADDLLKSKGFR
jgi:hypothetical protein